MRPAIDEIANEDIVGHVYVAHAVGGDAERVEKTEQLLQLAVDIAKEAGRRWNGYTHFVLVIILTLDCMND